MASSNMSQKFCKRQKLREDEDRISNLPESILVEILSCLPTKDAVRTCVLSKRWVHLWTSITNLHFDDRELCSRKSKRKKGKKKCFVDFVSRVLLHLTNSSILSFSLNLVNKYDPSLVNAWISAILNRRVRNLSFHCSEELTILPSHSLFSCKSLVQLVLDIDCTVRVPAFVHLPNLQDLKLSKFELTSDSSVLSKELILSFPVLKKFECENCIWSNVQNVNLQVPLLEKVILKFYKFSVLHKPESCVIKFCASRLREFSYDGLIPQDYILSDPSSALNASAVLLLSYSTDVRDCMLLKQFSQVKYLKLDRIKFSGQAKEFFEYLPAAFTMLRHLQLGIVSGDVLMEFLLKSPNLSTLDIEGVSKFDEELLDSTVVPRCLSATLKVIKLGELNGYEDELCLAKFVMENALVLERLSFSPTWNLRHSKSKMEQVKEKLFSFKKGFNLAIIDFSNICVAEKLFTRHSAI